MSNTYKLTAEIHQLINQINQKKRKGLRVESHTNIYAFSENEIGTWNIYFQEAPKKSIPTFTAENIQRLLCELELGESPKYAKKWWFAEHIIRYSQLEEQTKSLLEYEPQTQAKALSDKWFGLREETEESLLLSNPPQKPQPKPTLSLWNSGEEGQIQVLTGLKEVLESYLNN